MGASENESPARAFGDPALWEEAMPRSAEPAPTHASGSREARVEGLLRRLRADAEGTPCRMAERLTDLPEEQSSGQVELDLRDLARDLASSSHRAGLQAGEKGATAAPASPAPAAATPASSATARRPG